MRNTAKENKMIEEMIKQIPGIMIGLWVAVVISIIVDPNWEQLIVQKGHAEYNSTTGKFQFLPPCK